MSTITIPKRLIKDDLIVISRKEYERILHLARKKYPHFDFDKDLDRAIEGVRQGKVIGPFSSVKSLRVSLEK